MFIVETDSEEELNEILKGLLLSEVSEAKVTPLKSFEELRRGDDRQRHGAQEEGWGPLP